MHGEYSPSGSTVRSNCLPDQSAQTRLSSACIDLQLGSTWRGAAVGVGCGLPNRQASIVRSPDQGRTRLRVAERQGAVRLLPGTRGLDAKPHRHPRINHGHAASRCHLWSDSPGGVVDPIRLRSHRRWYRMCKTLSWNCGTFLAAACGCTGGYQSHLCGNRFADCRVIQFMGYLRCEGERRRCVRRTSRRGRSAV
jgi:hypothetical protein